MSELLPLPHSPVTAIVKGGSVFSFRRNRERPRATALKSKTSASPASMGRSETRRLATEGCGSTSAGGLLKAGTRRSPTSKRLRQ